MSQGYSEQHVVFYAAKESWLAYLLWFFVGVYGAHKFYLNQNLWGFIYLPLGLLGTFTLWIYGVGLIFLVPVWIMMIIDLFMIPGRVKELNSSSPNPMIRQ